MPKTDLSYDENISEKKKSSTELQFYPGKN